MKKIIEFLVFLIFCSDLSATIPKHLIDLRLLEENTLPQNTHYQSHDMQVLWKGEEGSTEYICRTNCSGLINALLKYSYPITQQQLEIWLGKKKPKAREYYETIVKEKGWKRIKKITAIVPGDVLAVKFPPHSKDTGHVMVVDAFARSHLASPPFLEGSKQWLVKIIDCTSAGHGSTDSRYLERRKYRGGIGQGYLRVYTDQKDEMIGYSWSASRHSRIRDSETHPIACGRLSKHF